MREPYYNKWFAFLALHSSFVKMSISFSSLSAKEIHRLFSNLLYYKEMFNELQMSFLLIKWFIDWLFLSLHKPTKQCPRTSSNTGSTVQMIQYKKWRMNFQALEGGIFHQSLQGGFQGYSQVMPQRSWGIRFKPSLEHRTMWPKCYCLSHLLPRSGALT